MTDLNYFIFQGKLTADGVLSKTKTGQDMLTFVLAVNRDKAAKNSAGQVEYSQSASFFRLSIYGNRASAVAKYFTQGRTITVEGHVETSSWTDAAGTKKYGTDFIISNFWLNQKPHEKDSHAEESESPDAIPMFTSGSVPDAFTEEGLYGN